MRTYSSGMYSRLAFSVAVHMDPDILMIDEALSAGDASFKTKAAEKMAELREQRPRDVPRQPLAGLDPAAVQRRHLAAQGRAHDARRRPRR